MDEIPNVKNLNTFFLCRQSLQKAICYKRMKAFGNHFRVENANSPSDKTYDSGVASMFEIPREDAQNVAVNYVGVLKGILKLDYGGVCTSIIFLRCDWLKPHDNRGNPTYNRDDVRFLLVNF